MREYNCNYLIYFIYFCGVLARPLKYFKVMQQRPMTFSTRLGFSRLFSAIGLLMVVIMISGCGALELLDSEKEGSGDGTGLNDPCHINYPGPDSDGDGLSDDCEGLTGQDPFSTDSDGDGIQDNRDFPGDPLNPQNAQNQAWYQDFLNQLLSETSYGNVLTGSFLNENAPLGSTVEVQEQKIYVIIDGQYGHSEGLAHLNFCQENEGSNASSFLYFYIRGNVSLCDSCQQVNETMELCGTLPESWNVEMFEENEDYLIEDFTWHIGRIQAGTFDPLVMIKKDETETLVTITPKQYESNGSDVTFQKVKIRFDDTFRIQGQATVHENSSGVDFETPTNISVQRNFQRNFSGSAEENPYVVGRFVNN